MKYGFIKVAAATPEIKVADCIWNGEQTIKLIEEAEQQSVKVLVFPELGISGYTCGDLFLQNSLLDAARKTTARFCARALELIMETDRAMKTSLDAPERLLEMLILQLAMEGRNG